MPFWWHSKVGLEWLAGKSLKPDLSVNILSISKLVNLSIVLLRRHCVLKQTIEEFTIKVTNKQ